jgi:hypothetical protein
MSTATIVETASDWISTREARRILEISRARMAHIIEAGGVTSRRFPGCHPMVLRRDVERLSQDSIRPATLPAACA